jgi:hypothetical protein
VPVELMLVEADLRPFPTLVPEIRFHRIHTGAA